MSALRPLPETVIRRAPSLCKAPAKQRDDGLLEVEQAARAIYIELAPQVTEMEAEQPELAVWLTTALWMLEMAAKDLATETDVAQRRKGLSLAMLQAMRISCGLELAAAMGFLDGDPSGVDGRLAGIVSRLERERDAT